MNQQIQVTLIEEVLDMADKKLPYLDESMNFTPVDRYISAERFTREREMMRRTPLPTLLASELPENGSFATKQLAGLPLLLTRDEEGQVHGFLNVCRHRGTRLVDAPCGKKRRFACPYHAWTWDNKGDLQKIPHQETGFPDLDMADKALVRVTTGERYGMVWVCLDGESLDDLDTYLGEMADEISWLECQDHQIFVTDEIELDANWKVLAEGGIESYHFKVAHRKTIAPHFLDNLSTYRMLGPHMRSVLPRENIVSIREKPQDEWDIRDNNNLILTIFPTNQFLVQKDHFVWIESVPLAHDKTRLRLSTVVPKPKDGEFSYDETQHWEHNHKITMETLQEDFAIGESIQSGLDSGANTELVLGRFEGALHAFNTEVEAALER